MNTKFPILVEELEKAGAIGHEAYEIANQIDSRYYLFENRDNIAKIAHEIIEEQRQLDDALLESF